MSDNNNNAKTMYEAVPAAAELNKVPGFDPLKFLRRAGDSMKLDLPYQKLWFRMAHPNGRMRLTAMRITEQMAIFEAKVFLDRSDAEPFSVSVAQQTMQDSRDFVKAAQNEALSQALSDAGFGIQLVSADTHAASVQKAAPVSKTQPSAITPPVSTVLPQEPSSASQKAAVLSEGNSVSGGTQTPQRASENAETARTKIQPAATPAHEQSLPVSPTTNTDTLPADSAPTTEQPENSKTAEELPIHLPAEELPVQRPAEDLTVAKEAQEVPEAKVVQEAPAYTPGYASRGYSEGDDAGTGTGGRCGQRRMPGADYRRGGEEAACQSAFLFDSGQQKQGQHRSGCCPTGPQFTSKGWLMRSPGSGMKGGMTNGLIPG